MARTLTRLWFGIAIGGLLCMAQPLWPTGRALAARLTPKDSGRAKQARQLYKEGNYEEAAKIYSDLSSAHPDMLVFTRNLGACYYYLRRPEPALSNLREYLHRHHDLTAEDRREVEGWIAEMEQLRDQSAAPAVAAPAGSTSPVAAPPEGEAPATASPLQPPAARAQVAAPPDASAGAVPGSPVAASPPPVTSTVSVEEGLPTDRTTAPGSPGHGLRVAGLATGAIGLAAIGTAVYFYTRATSLADKISSADAPSPADFKSGKNAETMQWVFYSLGGAALAGGAVLYYLGWQRGSAGPEATAVAPMVGPGLVGLSAQGAF